MVTKGAGIGVYFRLILKPPVWENIQTTFSPMRQVAEDSSETLCKDFCIQ